MNLYGRNIVVSNLLKPIPKIQLRPDFQWCSEDFRRDFNAWLLEEFGAREVAILIPGTNTLVVDPGSFAKIKSSLPQVF